MLPPIIKCIPHKERGYRAWWKHPKGYDCVSYAPTEQEAKKRSFAFWQERMKYEVAPDYNSEQD